MPCYLPQASGIVRSVDISLILPAFNESTTIATTIREAVSYFSAQNYRYELIVAADGNDGTREKARELALAYSPSIKSDRLNRARRGKGRGIREAVAIASGKVIRLCGCRQQGARLKSSANYGSVACRRLRSRDRLPRFA